MAQRISITQEKNGTARYINAGFASAGVIIPLYPITVPAAISILIHSQNPFAVSDHFLVILPEINSAKKGDKTQPAKRVIRTTELLPLPARSTNQSDVPAPMRMKPVERERKLMFI